MLEYPVVSNPWGCLAAIGPVAGRVQCESPSQSIERPHPVRFCLQLWGKGKDRTNQISQKTSSTTGLKTGDRARAPHLNWTGGLTIGGWSGKSKALMGLVSWRRPNSPAAFKLVDALRVILWGTLEKYYRWVWCDWWWILGKSAFSSQRINLPKVWRGLASWKEIYSFLHKNYPRLCEISLAWNSVK